MNSHIPEHDVGVNPAVAPEQYHRPRPTSYKDKYDHVRARYDHAIRTNQDYAKAYEAAHAKQSSLQNEIDCLVDYMLSRAPPPSQPLPAPAPPPRAFYPPAPAPAPGSSAAQHANGGSNGADDTNGHSSKRQRRA